MKPRRSTQNKIAYAPRNKWRMWILQTGCLLLIGAIVWRVYDIQQVYGSTLKNDEQKSVDANHTVLAPRGSIEDSEGQNLAYDMPAYYLDFHIPDLKGYAARASAIIAPILGTSVTKVMNIIDGNYTWYQWKSVVNQTVKTNLQNAFNKHTWDTNKDKINWTFDVTFTPTEERVYPFNTFAANTIGYVATDGKAVGGIEQEFNQYLKGSNGLVHYEQDAYGYPMPRTRKMIKPAKPGDNVQLTINGNLQGYVEYQMDALIKKFKPSHAAIIVTNPQTGAILAMASRPTFNPNQYWAASSGALSTNWAISSSFEPGSTFKPFVMAAALATHSINLYTKYMSGHIFVDGKQINDWQPAGWGILTYQEALEKSSNVGFAKIALATGWKNLNHYLSLFGFNQKTGINLPNEATSILFPPSYQHSIQLATTGFGQGIAVTPLQQVEAMGAIANGGKLIQPRIVSEITSPNGKVIKSYKSKIIRQSFVPQSVLNTVKSTMVLDVSGAQGIDQAAEIPGYQVAGKTGTAQTVNPKTGKFYNNRYITSFIGFAPASDPVIEVYVTVDYPKTPIWNTWGSTVSAPFAKNIMEYMIQKLHIPPDNPTNMPKVASASLSPKNKVKYVQIPSIIGMSMSNAKTALTNDGLHAVLIGQRGNVLHQEPSAGVQVEKGMTVYGVSQDVQKSGAITVPNLAKLPMKEAVKLLHTLSLNGVSSGAGYVSTQSPPAGTKVRPNSTIRLTLKS